MDNDFKVPKLPVSKKTQDKFGWVLVWLCGIIWHDHFSQIQYFIIFERRISMMTSRVSFYGSGCKIIWLLELESVMILIDLIWYLHCSTKVRSNIEISMFGVLLKIARWFMSVKGAKKWQWIKAWVLLQIKAWKCNIWQSGNVWAQVVFTMSYVFAFFFCSLREYLKLVSHPHKLEFLQMIDKHVKEVSVKLTKMNAFLQSHSKCPRFIFYFDFIVIVSTVL